MIFDIFVYMLLGLVVMVACMVVYGALFAGPYSLGEEYGPAFEGPVKRWLRGWGYIVLGVLALVGVFLLFAGFGWLFVHAWRLFA